jgi:hypothetical protein
VTKETKIIVVLLALYLWWHWGIVQTVLATGMAGGAGNATPGINSTGGDVTAGPGNSPAAYYGASGTVSQVDNRLARFPGTWGTYE